MGQSSSSSVVWRNRGRRSSYHESFRRSKRPIISGPFSFPKLTESNELMNINIATEEQLMTLPGINRQLAREIVRHRDIIGPFKQIGDLLLISGNLSMYIYVYYFRYVLYVYLHIFFMFNF